MVESLGEETTQGTTPGQLPIAGFPGDDVRLELSYSEESAQYASHFELDGKTLRLRKPLDRDEKDLSSIMFQVWSVNRVESACVQCKSVQEGRFRGIPST